MFFFCCINLANDDSVRILGYRNCFGYTLLTCTHSLIWRVCLETMRTSDHMDAALSDNWIALNLMLDVKYLPFYLGQAAIFRHISLVSLNMMEPLWVHAIFTPLCPGHMANFVGCRDVLVQLVPFYTGVLRSCLSIGAPKRRFKT